MKIVAVLEESLASGGGFNQALNAILQIQKLCAGQFDFEVVTTHSPNIDLLAKLNIASRKIAFSAVDRFLGHFSSYPWWHSLQARLKLTGGFERALIRSGCDLVYFVSPSARSATLQMLNFMTAVWDACHRDVPEFPEGRAFGQFQMREHHFRNRLSAALLVLTDSVTLAKSLERRYGLEGDRLLPMPFAPAPALLHTNVESSVRVLDQYHLQKGYFFYPAQFWPHKNHVRIIEALALLRARGQIFRVVFAGGDQGNRHHVELLVEKHGLREQARFLGFVPGEHMRALYDGCLAVVMPTYFGPTNLPPLEAWLIGRPLIYSMFFRDQVADAALCIDPDDAGDLAQAMLACCNDDVRDRLVRAGKTRLAQVEKERATAEVELLRRLRVFAARRACWT